MLHFFVRVLLVGSLLFLPALTADSAQDEILLAKMKVVREINLGGVYEYEVDCEGRGRAILKTPPKRLKVGEAVNIFVIEGAKEGGKPAYMGLKCDSPRSFKEDFAAVKIGDSWHFIDKNGKLLSQRGFKAVTNFQNGFALVRLEKGFGFLGKDGELLPTPTIETRDLTGKSLLDMRTGFSEGVAVMGSWTANYKRVVIMLDTSGSVIKVLGGKEIGYALYFTEGLAAVKKDGKWGFINKNNETAIPFQFIEANPFKEGLAAVSIPEKVNSYNGKWGFIDKRGKQVIDAKYDFVGDFSEGLAAARIGDKYGFIDKGGNVKVNPIYDTVLPFSEGLAVVKRNELYGAVDKAGRVVIKFLYSDMGPFANGLAVAQEKRFDGKYGYIDKTGKFVIAKQFEEAASYSDGLALVRQDVDEIPKYKYINTKGQAALWFYMPSR